MHTNPKYIEKWVEYACFDTEITFFLREALAKQLCHLKTDKEGQGRNGLGNNLELYSKYWLPFGELLTDMEREGIAVDIEHLRSCEELASKDRVAHLDYFTKWV